MAVSTKRRFVEATMKRALTHKTAQELDKDKRTPREHVPATPDGRLGYSIRGFCRAVGISVAYYYELKTAGLAPRVMQFGRRKIISTEEAAIWCRERTARPVPSKEAAARPGAS
jgi:hypothetical protein